MFILFIYYYICLVKFTSNEHRMNIGWTSDEHRMNIGSKSNGQRLGSGWAAVEHRLPNCWESDGSFNEKWWIFIRFSAVEQPMLNCCSAAAHPISIRCLFDVYSMFIRYNSIPIRYSFDIHSLFIRCSKFSKTIYQ